MINKAIHFLIISKNSNFIVVTTEGIKVWFALRSERNDNSTNGLQELTKTGDW